jgi:hypothetical protein
MAIVNIGASDMKRFTTLPGGQFGPGLQYDADVELTQFQYPAAEKNLPGYDRSNERGPYGFFLFRITLPDGDSALVRMHTDNLDKMRAVLTGAGVEIAVHDDGVGFGFDPDQVAPRKVGGVEIKEPREGNDGNTYTGDVIRVIGA